MWIGTKRWWTTGSQSSMPLVKRFSVKKASYPRRNSRLKRLSSFLKSSKSWPKRKNRSLAERRWHRPRLGPSLLATDPWKGVHSRFSLRPTVVAMLASQPSLLLSKQSILSVRATMSWLLCVSYPSTQHRLVKVSRRISYMMLVSPSVWTTSSPSNQPR